MPNIINHQAADIAYVELTHDHEHRVELCFVWVDDRLFLPASLLDDDPAEAVSQVLKADIDIFSLGSLNYFVPFQWLEEQRPDLTELLKNIREAAEPFRHKLEGDPCRVCPKKMSGTCDNSAQ